MSFIRPRYAFILGLLAALSPAAKAAEIDAFDMHRCVNMGNSLDSPRGEPWGLPINPDHFTLIKQKGFDTVRIPVRWSDYTAGSPNFQIEPDFLTGVSDVVDNALSHNLNVILNVHHFEEIMVDPDNHTQKLYAIWAQLADHFKHRSDSLWFEVINEPFNELKGDKLLMLQAKTVREIRKSNPDRVIILGGEEWSNIRTLDTNIMPPDANIVYTFHYYDPFDFTHQKAPWLGKDMPRKKRKWGNDEDRKELDNAMKIATEFKQTLQRPLFVGEFGAYEGIKNAQRVKYVNGVRTALDDANIPWCLWSFSNTFALYDPTNKQWDQDMLEALIPPHAETE